MPTKRALQHAYMVILIGQGDTHVKVVDKEIWDWFHSPRPAFKPGEYCFDELQIAPEKVRAAVIKEAGDAPDEAEIGVTSGSWENDRMVICPSDACLFEEYGDTSSIQTAIKWAKTNGYKIVEREEGCIY